DPASGARWCADWRKGSYRRGAVEEPRRPLPPAGYLSDDRPAVRVRWDYWEALRSSVSRADPAAKNQMPSGAIIQFNQKFCVRNYIDIETLTTHDNNTYRIKPSRARLQIQHWVRD